MQKTYKTIRITEDTYNQLMDYRAELEAKNRSRISIDEAIDMLMGEAAGLEYEVRAEVARFAKAQDDCQCGACASVAPPIEYQMERLGR